MPTRTRLVVILLAAAGFTGRAVAQEAPSSSYRLRPERGQPLHVDEEPRPARALASLSDDEPEGAESGDSGQEPRDSGQEPQIAGPREGENEGLSENETHVSPSFSPTPPIRARHNWNSASANERQPLKLAPRSETGGRQLARPNPAANFASLGTVGGALAVVLGLFAIIVWITRRVGPTGSAPLPREAVELLGRTTISGQHAVQLVRVGRRLLLVALAPQGATTLTEITDPAEVERLTAICLRQRPDSSSASFAQTVAQLERESTGRSFVDQRRPASSAASARSRSARAA